jgi:hypothetical protein
MIHYTDYRGQTLEKACSYMNTMIDLSKIKIEAIETKNFSGTYTIRVWWTEK